MRFAKEQTPGFKWDILTIRSTDTGLPQSRTRIYIVGYRGQWAVRSLKLPPAMPAVALMTLLSQDVEPVETAETLGTAGMEKVAIWKKRLQMMRRDESLKGRLAVVELDRNPNAGSGFCGDVQVDVVPTLRTHDNKLFVISLGEGEGEPSICRSIMKEELFAIQGFRADDFPHTLSRSNIVHVCGNAMSVPAVGWALWALAAISNVPGLCKPSMRREGTSASSSFVQPPGDFEV